MIRRAQPWLGTLVEITADSVQPARSPAITQAFAEVALVHRLMSFHDAASDVSRLNRAAPGELLEVHPHTWQVLRLAAQMAELSQGLFNIACAPRLVDWLCLPRPDNAESPAYQPALAVYRCEPEPQVRKLAHGWVDVGGIAKGYAVDLAVAALQRAGAGSGCVNAGGDLRGFGPLDWPVAVRDPLVPGRAGARLSLRDEALATSAAYFSARRHGGREISALVDGRNGEPLLASISVSVRAPRCAVADALTKVVLASGDAQHPALAASQASAFII
ncbi:FAD:protein FMN transferase [Duganella violaceipulchra]|uniref:FAD:protein FMN transferase n=1 Tax=Duganella violaceipulchra TaxID=2849652 RepID=A0AA41H334_9BURK|nr:FAD:protein FMN transferase [Duganella violaceicalia]MBV6319342.1 FAD:protein FMN transferase [Duganella violaceicalia]MCP2006846.1 thiamine biosynthesis lipoprotein [Duganella violaceicalia]